MFDLIDAPAWVTATLLIFALLSATVVFALVFGKVVGKTISAVAEREFRRFVPLLDKEIEGRKTTIASLEALEAEAFAALTALKAYELDPELPAKVRDKALALALGAAQHRHQALLNTLRDVQSVLKSSRVYFASHPYNGDSSVKQLESLEADLVAKAAAARQDILSLSRQLP